ncbi:MAG: class I SAM-dependent methyltransferase [Ktedonobacteraceae bacterium]
MLSAIVSTTLEKRTHSRTNPLRILDAACGTGLLLAQLSQRFPQAELYGVDENQGMLEQAARLLKGRSCIHIVQAALGGGETAELSFAAGSFDLITSTNSLHYFKEPSAALKGFKHLLAPGGQIVLDDYTLRGFPLPWKAFEWMIKFYDPQHIRLYTF